MNRISLGIYIHNNPKENTAWFDDVVLSTGYIGPVANAHTKRSFNGDRAPRPGLIRLRTGRIALLLLHAGEVDLRACDARGRIVWQYRCDRLARGLVEFDLPIRTCSGTRLVTGCVGSMRVAERIVRF